MDDAMLVLLLLLLRQWRNVGVSMSDSAGNGERGIDVFETDTGMERKMSKDTNPLSLKLNRKSTTTRMIPIHRLFGRLHFWLELARLYVCVEIQVYPFQLHVDVVHGSVVVFKLRKSASACHWLVLLNSTPTSMRAGVQNRRSR